MAISHLLYADDAIFIGEWSDSNLDNIVKILKCFFLAPGLKINIQKSQVLGVGVPRNIVNQAASLIGCAVMQNPFRHLGVMVGDSMSQKLAWADTVQKLRSRLSKWKDKVMASKKNGGLGVSSFHALNRALLLKWVWRFLSQDGSPWYRVIQALYGASFELHPVNQSSIWCSILREMQVLISKGFDFVSHCKKRVGDGRFWYDSWVFDQPLRVRFPCLFALETDKESTVASNLGSSSMTVGPKFGWVLKMSGISTFDGELDSRVQRVLDNHNFQGKLGFVQLWECGSSGDLDDEACLNDNYRFVGREKNVGNWFAGRAAQTRVADYQYDGEASGMGQLVVPVYHPGVVLKLDGIIEIVTAQCSETYEADFNQIQHSLMMVNLTSTYLEKTIKVQHSELVKSTLPCSAKLADLQEQVIIRFNELENKTFSIAYKDANHNLHSILSDHHLQFCIAVDFIPDNTHQNGC
nr:PB1 domain-containing protein [Tanacetum cinerariifolium]